MIFTAWQLFENSRDHDESLCALFVDLHKSYNSVSRQLDLAVGFEGYDAVLVMLSLIRSCYDDITAVVRVSSDTNDDMNIKNAQGQGSTMAPIYTLQQWLHACWRGQCPEARVTVWYKTGRYSWWGIGLLKQDQKKQRSCTRRVRV